MRSQLLILKMPLDLVEITIATSIVVGVNYMAYLLVGIQVMMLFMTIVLASSYLILRRWIKIKEKGLIHYCSSKLRSLLLQRSILDIFRDLVYFPYVTKIIAAYLRIAASKPHPEEIQTVINQLPKEVSEISTRKGLLSLAPEFVEEIILPTQNRQLLPKNYGLSDWKWDNEDKYHKSHQQVHTQTLQKRVVHFLDGKLGWPAAVALLSCTIVGAMHMKPHRFKKMLLQNATFVCMILSLVALLIKAKKTMRHNHNKPKALSYKQD